MIRSTWWRPDDQAAVNRLARTLIGDSPAMEAVRSLVAHLAPLDLPVLVRGDTGTGKELVARALHDLSGRRGAFVAFNVSEAPDTMFTATLFGHKRGAFTGAVESTRGLCAAAADGTLFLDEIGTLALPQQAALLRVLETRAYRPVGSTELAHSAFRIVAATNENLASLVQARRFRLDLFHRLTGMTVRLPRLAERPEDVTQLARHFLAEVATGDRALHLDESALAALCASDWPGNVRELRQAVHRLAALARRSTISAEDVAACIGAGDGFVLSASEAIPSMPSSDDLRAALVRVRGDVRAMASTFGVGRSTVYRWLEHRGIPTPKRRRGQSKSDEPTRDLPPAPPADRAAPRTEAT